MSEIVREQTPIENVASAIRNLTYGEIMEVGASIRDIIGDRKSDGEDMADSRTIADILHSWAETVFADADEDPADAR